MPRIVALLAAAAAAAVAVALPTLSVDVGPNGTYNVSVDGAVWLSSASTFQLCVAGTQATLSVTSSQPATGSDKFGPWSGTAVTLTSTAPAAVTYTFKVYANNPSIAVLTASFPEGVDTTGCGGNTLVSTQFPSFDTGAAAAPNLTWVSWKGSTLPAIAGHGLGSINTNALDVGPAVLSDGSAELRTLTVSTLVRGLRAVDL